MLAIVSAMREELCAVLALMPDEQPQRVAARDFWLGHLHGCEVVAVLSGIGKVAAATTAAILVERFRVDAIVLTGVAGGLAPGIAIGDVVVADRFLQHDVDASPIFARWEVPLYGRASFDADARLADRLALAVRKSVPQAAIHRGLVVSGDRFVSTAAERRQLQEDLPDALAVEMEGAAFAQVCHDYGVPFAAVRTISDCADDGAPTDFLRFVEETASRYSTAIVEAFLRS